MRAAAPSDKAAKKKGTAAKRKLDMSEAMAKNSKKPKPSGQGKRKRG
jgi:hypothetical protein